MKNLLKNMFGRNNLKISNESSIVESLPVSPQHDLFVNDLNPEENVPKESGFDRINKFLNHDHFSNGLAQGFLMHSEAGMQLFIKDLKSRFRLEMNAMDELFRDLILSKRKKLIDLGEMFPNIREQLMLEITADEEMREELKYQKIMSVEEEGWISQVLYAFEKGYSKGMLDYINLKEFSSRGLL